MENDRKEPVVPYTVLMGMVPHPEYLSDDFEKSSTTKKPVVRLVVNNDHAVASAEAKAEAKKERAA